jgi:hypothetical protein
MEKVWFGMLVRYFSARRHFSLEDFAFVKFRNNP